MTETVVTVGLGERSYPIRISSGLLDKIGRDRIASIIASGDAMDASAMLREALLG